MTAPSGPADSVRSQATEIARGWSPAGAPPSWGLTAAIFTRLARDDDLVALAAEIPAPRMPALLFCAAACHLIAERRPSGLIDYFPAGGEPQPPLDGRFGPSFSAFCLDHRADLSDLFEQRRYQMNEVARSTQVALALSLLGRRHNAAEVALIDLGAGAGLGLHLDRYFHQLSDGTSFGDPTSPLALHCEVDGSPPSSLPPSSLSPSLPAIGLRIGIDLDPIDLADPGDRAWARSCIPPEAGSLARFERASRVVMSHPFTVVRGDAVEALPAILEDLPAHLLPVVVDSYTAVFFSAEERAHLRSILGHGGADGRLAWISLDPLVPLGTAGRDSVQGLDVPSPLVVDYQHRGVFALLGLVTFDHGEESGVLLARAHPSGTSLTWLEEVGAGR